MKTTLLIMAAGIGSRFGTGIKQLEPVDASNHIIMDYSIHDAIEAGFNHVVFIIRKDIEKEFKEVIGDRIASICSSHNVTVDYAFQDINDIPGTLPEDRTKPWGTGQAVLAAKKVINFRLNLKNVCTNSIGKIFSNLCGNAAGGEVSNKSFAHDKCTSFD